MNDIAILDLIARGRIIVDADNGLAYSTASNTPDSPIGCWTAKGYLRACISYSGRQHHFMVHRIVWVSVHGAVPPGFEIDHRNRVKYDNRLSNLECVPGSINIERARQAGAFRGVGRRDGIRDSNGRFGKKAAGRTLDGKIHDEYPEVNP